MNRLFVGLSALLAGVLLVAGAVIGADAGLVYVVRPGDTLYQISLRYRVPVEAIASVNSLDDPASIVPGQVLKIPNEEILRQANTPTRQPVSPGTQPALIAVHRVRSGDTLLGIAWRYRVTVDMIKQANGLWTDVILPGQQLDIPTRGSVAALARRYMPAPQPIPVPRVAFQRTAREGSQGAKIVRDAKRYLGIRYVWGGTSGTGLDCSGLIYRVFSPYMRSVGRLRSYEYFQVGKVVPPEGMLPGDLVFFTTDDPGPSHMGIFIGDGKFIHASSTAGGVTITSLDDPFYGARFLGVRRLLNP